MSEADVKAALSKANVPSATANEIIKVNKQSQIDGLRTAEAILALLALIALPFTRGIPTVQPGAQAKPTAARDRENARLKRRKRDRPQRRARQGASRFAELNADENDAATPRRVPPSKTRPVTAHAGPHSAPASRFQSPDWNDGRATAASDHPFTSTSQLIATQGHPEISDSATVRSHRATNSFAGLPMAQAALKFASARHANQYREIDHAPFIAHPIEVGSLLRRDGQPDEVIAAGLLHDVLEKTGTTRAELQRRFGARIAGLVESVSDDPSIDDYGSRKRELRDRVAHAGSDTVAIFAADKISKVRELALLATSRLDKTTTRAKLAHYRASLKMLRRVAGNSALVDLLDAELAQSGSRSNAAVARQRLKV